MSERILSAAARRTCLGLFLEMSLSTTSPENVPAMYFINVRVSERWQAVGCHGRGAAFYHRGGACPKQAPLKDLFSGAKKF